MFLSPHAAGDKCSGPCANGYRCPPSCKDLTKEIKKMHDDSHTYSHCYCSHCGTIYCQTLEQEQVTSQEHINSCDFSYVETRFAVLTFQRYLETVKKQSSEEQFCPISLFTYFSTSCLNSKALFFCDFNPEYSHFEVLLPWASIFSLTECPSICWKPNSKVFLEIASACCILITCT